MNVKIKTVKGKVTKTKVTIPTFELADGTTPKFHSANHTTNESNFKIIENNRGDEKGFNLSRVKKLMATIMTPLFIWALSTIKVVLRGKNLWIIDGANRITAIRLLIKLGKLPKDYQIPFTVINEPILNKTKKVDLVSFIADFNNYDPRWKEREHIDCAIGANFITALEFNRVEKYLKTPKVLKKLGYIDNGKTKKVVIPPNILLSLATDKRLPSGTKLVFNDFRNDSIGLYMGTDEYMDKLDKFIDLIEYIKYWKVSNNTRTCKVFDKVLDTAYGKFTIGIPLVVNEILNSKVSAPMESNLAEYFNDIKLSIING